MKDKISGMTPFTEVSTQLEAWLFSVDDVSDGALSLHLRDVELHMVYLVSPETEKTSAPGVEHVTYLPGSQVIGVSETGPFVPINPPILASN